MTTTEQVAGHPIAIRVGGRRLSQSHPIRSPTKGASSTSPSASPEEATNVPQPVPDYPRPRSPQAATVEAEGGAAPETVTGEESTSQGNRQERRRQERKKDKYQTEEDKNNSTQRGFPYDGKNAHKEGKGSMGMDKARRSSGTSGVRITQPVGKFMT